MPTAFHKEMLKPLYSFILLLNCIIEYGRIVQATEQEQKREQEINDSLQCSNFRDGNECGGQKNFYNKGKY